MILHSNLIGAGKPLLILHGFLGMGDNWKTHAKQFADNGFEVHLIDQRNHGRSFWDNAFDYELLATDVKHYCENKNISSTSVLGHSMGGKTAMQLACTFPNLVDKLIVADISPRYYPIHHDTILEGLSQLDFSKITNRTEADEALSQYIPEHGIRQFLLKNLFWKETNKLGLRINLKVLKENLAEVGEPLPAHFTFNKSTLFVKGDKSEYIGPNDVAIIKQHFPFAKIETITNAGHWLHAENPKDFLETVISFLNKN